MQELIYSKKQIQPLIDKFKINAKENEIFANIIHMFDNQTNYQVWAIKEVFGGVCSFETINFIKEWIVNNQENIKRLSKGNVVSYKTSADIKLLMNEMKGLTMLQIINNNVNRFNTQQKKMLKVNIDYESMDALAAFNSKKINEWFDIFTKLETLPSHRRDKLISVATPIDSFDFLKEHIINALSATYEWNKQDMIAYAKINTPDCTIVYDKDNVVILQIPSFESSRKLCGNGRTGWCLTREEHYFNRYVKEPGDAKQFFLFDFSKREDDELAHVGFTVRSKNGIVNAHSTRNNNLLGDGISYKNKRVNIYQALKNASIPNKIFMSLPKLTKYEWNIESVVKYVNNHPDEVAICLIKDNKIVLSSLCERGLKNITNHTLISNISDFSRSKTYIILDFSKEHDDNDALVLASFSGDRYGSFSFSRAIDVYNSNITSTFNEYLSRLGITVSDFMGQEKIDPKILLHKYINEGREQEAIQLIEKEGDEFDVNYEFEQNVPVFIAMERNQFDLFNKIVNHKRFNTNISDAFGENLLQSLMYNYDENNPNAKDIKKMINSILNSPSFDFNSQDINLDTCLIVACSKPSLLWVAERLIDNPAVNVNIVNDFNCTALTTAIRKNLTQAIEMLLRRPDLVVREEDVILANELGINLTSMIGDRAVKPKGNDEETEFLNDLSKIFAKAFCGK